MRPTYGRSAPATCDLGHARRLGRAILRATTTEELLTEIKALRQDIETQTAINIIEGINTIETLAVVGHWMSKRRPPTPKEAADLERTARERWATQVRQAIAMAKKEPGGLDQSLGSMVSAIDKPRSSRAARSAKRRR